MMTTIDELLAALPVPAQTHDWSVICRTCTDTCCCCYPLPNELITQFSDRLQVPVECVPYDLDYSLPTTPDGKCPFLGRWDRQCAIYAQRPRICRLYGEIPELPCRTLHPQAALLAFDKLVGRLARRLGITIPELQSGRNDDDKSDDYPIPMVAF